MELGNPNFFPSTLPEPRCPMHDIWNPEPGTLNSLSRRMGIFMRRMIFLFFMAMVLILCCLSCEKGALNPPKRDTPFYYNSFETATDANGWSGISQDMFVQDPSPNSGFKSLNLGGGCIQPTAWFVFPKARSDGWYKLQCWGKIDQENQGGQVILKLEGDDTFSMEVLVFIKDRSWTYYESDLPIFCPKGKQLRLEMLVGGIIFASMHVDGLTLTRVPE
jgi:hypothetical protein